MTFVAFLRSQGQNQKTPLIEMALAVAILAVTALFVAPFYRSYQQRSQLESVREIIVEGLERARYLSKQAEGGSAWGFFVPSGTVFKGTSFDARDPQFDEVRPLPSSVSVSGGLLHITYSVFEGVPSQTGSIGLYVADEKGKSLLTSVSLDKEGVAASRTAEADLRKSNVMLAALPDKTKCPHRFVLNSDSVILATNELDVTIKTIASHISYGNGGPAIPVILYLSKDGGQEWQPLFHGQSVKESGGDVQTIAQIASGALLLLRARGKYRQEGWLAFDCALQSNDQDGSVILLRSGDALPSRISLPQRKELESLLRSRGFMDADTRSAIGSDAILILIEFSASSPPDFLDAVLLLEFKGRLGSTCVSKEDRRSFPLIG